MLELLDLRERGERLEPSRFEADPTVTETVRGIRERARVSGDTGDAAAMEARGERP